MTPEEVARLGIDTLFATIAILFTLTWDALGIGFWRQIWWWFAAITIATVVGVFKMKLG